MPAAPPPPQPKPPVEAPTHALYYGVKLPVMSKIAIELLMFRAAKGYVDGSWVIPPEYGSYTGEGRFMHAQRAALEILGRDFDWHNWSESCMRLFCDNHTNGPWSAITGPKSASKTTSAALYALLFWAMSPNDTAVIVCSTTVPGLRKRVWGEIKKMFRIFRKLEPAANLVESKTSIQTTKNDDLHGLFGIAVAGGQTERALGRIIGFHPTNLLIIVDEATDTPEAIIEACDNLDKVAGEFQGIVLGNAASRFDPHGKLCEPKDGWKSISVDDELWETKKGACLHLDGLKSPNIVAGRNRWPYLITQRDVDRAGKDYGGESSPRFWRFIRGFWPPDDIDMTVLTESMAIKFNVREKAKWMGRPVLGAALDTAFGGDRCEFRTFVWGMGLEKRKMIEFRESINVKLDAGSAEPIDYQIARQARTLCKERGIQPHHFGIDATGSGRGVAAILQREWSATIQIVEFGARASTRPVSADNPKPCCEEYDRFLTELYFAFRLFVECDQIRGLDDNSITQFCTRRYQMVGKGLYKLETKENLKKRTKDISPDEADCSVIAVEVCRRNGLQAQEGEVIAKADSDRALEAKRNREHARALDFDSHSDNYLSGEL